MKIKDIFNKIGKLIPIISLGIALDSYYITKTDRLEKINNEITTVNRLSSELERNKDIIVTQTDNQNKIASLSNDATEKINSIKQEENSIILLYNKLKNDKLTDENKNKIMEELDNHFNSLNQIVTDTKNDLNLINNIIESSKPKESNIFGNIELIINSYREYLSTLDLEQIAAICNLSGLISILFCLSTIIGILYGDYLIKYFNLENKLSKIKILFTFRYTVNKYTMLFNIILILIILFSLIIFNIHIFINN